MDIKTEEHPPYLGRTGWVIEWSAWDMDTYDGAEDSHCPVGSGSTEIEAINDLVEQIVERLEEQIDRQVGITGRLRIESAELVETINRLLNDLKRATGTRVLDEEETE
jgi:hypothetical protein